MSTARERGANRRATWRDGLITNKRAVGRPQDLIDADFLERVRAKTTR